MSDIINIEVAPVEAPVNIHITVDPASGNSGNIIQDNKDYAKRYYSYVLLSQQQLAELVNSGESFVVGETQSLWIFLSVPGIGFRPATVYKYKVFNKGKGTYGTGVGNIRLSGVDLELFFVTPVTPDDADLNPSTDTINYGNLNGQTIAQYLNGRALVTIQPQDEGYTLFKGSIDNADASYLWIGEPGSYGAGALQSTDADFQLLNETAPIDNFISYDGSQGNERLTGIIKVDDVGARRGYGGSIADYIPEYFDIINFDTLTGMGNNYPEMAVYNLMRNIATGLRATPFGVEIFDTLKAGLYGTDDFTEKALQNPYAYLQVKGIVDLINTAIAGGGNTIQDLADVLAEGNTSLIGFTIGTDGVITAVSPDEIITAVTDGRMSRLTHNGLELQASTSGSKIRLTGGTQTSDHVALLQDKSYTVAGLDDITTAIDIALSSVYRAAGNHNASTGLFPTIGTGPSGGIRRGDVFNVSTEGTIAGERYDVGDTFYANVPNPGQVATNWKRFEVNTSQATSSYRGTVFLFNSTGTSTNGTIDQNTLTILFASKATAAQGAKADSALQPSQILGTDGMIKPELLSSNYDFVEQPLTIDTGSYIKKADGLPAVLSTLRRTGLIPIDRNIPMKVDIGNRGVSVAAVAYYNSNTISTASYIRSDIETTNDAAQFRQINGYTLDPPSTATHMVLSCYNGYTMTLYKRQVVTTPPVVFKDVSSIDMVKAAQIMSCTSGITAATEGKSLFARAANAISFKDKGVLPLILVVGQSNADGRAPQSSAPSWLNSGNGFKLDNFMMWNKTNNTFQSYQLGVNTGADDNTDTRFAADVLFAKKYLDANGGKLYCIKHTLGGIPISELGAAQAARWQPKTELITSSSERKLVDELRIKIETAIAYANANNLRLQPLAILYHQGESDATDAARLAAYPVNLQNLLSYLRGLLHNDKMLVVNFETIASYGNNAQINAIYQRINAIDLNFKTVVMTGHQEGVDDLHYAFPALDYAAAQMLSIVTNFVPENPATNVVNPTTVSLTKAQLNMAYPDAPIGFRVLCPSITGGGAVYTKTIESGTNDTWLMTSAVPVS
jgi:hypothetical protein